MRRFLSHEAGPTTPHDRTVKALQRPVDGKVEWHTGEGLDWLSEDSAVLLLRHACVLPESERKEVDKCLEDCPKTPNRMNPTTHLHRKQLTCGAAYDFGSKVPNIADPQHWPQAAHTVMAAAKEAVRALETSDDRVVRDLVKSIGGQPASEALNAVHMNLYCDSKVGIQHHSDDETTMWSGAPIVSVTALTSDAVERRVPRAFHVHRKFGSDGRKLSGPDWSTESATRVYMLHDGDVLIMLGRMQSEFVHSVPPMRGKRQECRRVNMTVRAFRAQ